MKALLRVYLFSYLLQTIVSFDCPNGGFQIPNEDICVYSVTNAKSYSQAKSECQSLGGIPSKIQNIFENAFIFASITTDYVYIGVELGSDKTFVYSDGTPLVYQNWAPNQPDKTKPCTAMDPQTGKWTSVDCESIRPYTCTSNGAYNSRCPAGWIYNATLGYCYYMQEFTYTDDGKWKFVDWTTAESICSQTTGAHLVSIHSKAEEDFVYDLIKTNLANVTSPEPNNLPCGGLYSFVGLFGNGTIGNGNWTDGSPVDYPSSPYQPFTYYYWMLCNDPSCDCHMWNWAVLGTMLPRFVCKKSLTS